MSESGPVIFIKLISKILNCLIGQISWSPPTWLTQSAHFLRQRTTRRGWVLSIVTAGLVGLGLIIQANAPQPIKISVSGTWPKLMPKVPSAMPGLSIDIPPLVIRFSGSVAPLNMVGENPEKDLSISPPLKGIWRWASDQELVFKPAEAWEVGKKYRVSFAPSLCAKQVMLESQYYDFASPSFIGALADFKLYDNPVDPGDKRVTAAINFSHPVDRASFERSITMSRQRMNPGGRNYKDEGQIQFKVSYSYGDFTAYIHSEKVVVAAEPQLIALKIQPGFKSSLGGLGTDFSVANSVQIPEMSKYFRVESVQSNIINNKDNEPERILTLTTSVGVSDKDLKDKLEIYLLPKDKPEIGTAKAVRDFNWTSVNEFVPEVAELSTKVEPSILPAEQDFPKVRGIKFDAEPGHRIVVKLNRGLKSFGGFELTDDYAELFTLADFPKSVKIMHEGSILSLIGSKRLSIAAHNLDAVQFTLYRLLPGSIHNLVSQTFGAMQTPLFDNWNFSLDNLAEISSRVEILPKALPGKPQYTSYDFSKSLRADGNAPRGMFVLEASAYDPVTKASLGITDQRLVLVTDLGIIAKKAQDGSHDVFVQSISAGQPVQGAKVSVLGLNGAPVFSSITDSLGRVEFPTFKDLNREKRPIAYIVEYGADSSFLPMGRDDRLVNLSRFDVGGLRSSQSEEGLQAYLFTDRGIYRPGEEAHIGVVVRDNNWKPIAAGLPLEFSIEDPRGIEVKREKVGFDEFGLADLVFSTRDMSPIGSYSAKLSIVRGQDRQTILGSTSLKVEEFLPDRLRLSAILSPKPTDGWISPENVSLKLNLSNLFGAPAVDNLTKASFRLAPAFPSFTKFKDYYFADPLKSKNSFEDNLGEKKTDSAGTTQFDLNLARFERGIYRLSVLAEGFEAEGGRSVKADAAALVSSLPFLVGYKLDGGMDFLKKNSERNVSLLAVSPDLSEMSPEGLTYEFVQTKYVSALTREDDGTFDYQSVKKEVILSKNPLPLPGGRTVLKLDTSLPGSLSLVVRDKDGLELNRVDYTVVGAANVERSLERNAELQIKLNKSDYAPNEEIEVEIQAPYVGAGLITIEQEKVHAFSWFKTSTTSSVQKIRVPESLDSNGYVTVSFVRDLGSRDIFMSPVSHGSAPFSISRKRRTNPISISAPERIKPGEKVKIAYKLSEDKVSRSRVIIAAVDEGILQVARFKNPDPLSHFFRKRALEVETRQILDLLLPEFDMVRSLSGTGGDEDSFRARNLNPFKRKGQKPTAFWSGIIAPTSAEGSVEYEVPEYFNGNLKIYALAVSPDSIGTAEAATLSKGDFVLSPNLPLFAAPGDEFEATVSAANNVDGSGSLPVELEITTGPGLTVVGESKAAVSVKESEQGTASFTLRANQVLGETPVVFKLRSGAKSTRFDDSMSIRPAVPLKTDVISGVIVPGMFARNAETTITRRLYPEYRELKTAASHSPLILARGLQQFLKKYPFGCSEQLISQAWPEMILSTLSEFDLDSAKVRAHLANTFGTLLSRQNMDGGISLWGGGEASGGYESAYAAQFVLEARDLGFNPPQNLLDRLMNYQRAVLSQDLPGLAGRRVKAYAIYNLTRNGEITTNDIQTLREDLDANFRTEWRKDILALYIGAAYRLLKLDREADAIASQVAISAPISVDYDNYYDELAFKGQYLSLISKYFPNRSAKESKDIIQKLADELSKNRFNTISSAFSILGFYDYTRGRALSTESNIRVVQNLKGGAKIPLALPPSPLGVIDFGEEAQSLSFSSPGTDPLFFSTSLSGYDRDLPAAEIREKLEVYREFRNLKGERVTSVNRGDEVNVYISVRAIGSPDAFVPDIAIVDLLPAGLEVDASGRSLLSQTTQSSPVFWSPVSAEVREDRVFFFGSADASIRQFSYRAKASAKGKFVVPPIAAFSMYDASVQSLSLGGSFEVK